MREWRLKPAHDSAVKIGATPPRLADSVLSVSLARRASTRIHAFISVVDVAAPRIEPDAMPAVISAIALVA